ncbi:hypothetical protein ABVB69_32300 [Streptomyces sp. NPDC000349]|uniref:hypothetical protein n=1 Tax=unclassified Streptomyces TaxID=2593676 RepID=UPI0027817C3C|nr:hypothetical protein [Streptomyces sp. DSM 40167]MDQ0408865.1 citrate lyase alpha subunit [Streptomyces sp. DSM 40167]
MIAAATAAALAASALLPSAAEAASAPTAAPAKACASKWKAKQRVAVRRPGPQDGPVATMRSPIHHHLRKGQVVRSCVVAVGRTVSGPAYRACGGEGHVWRIVPGGQVPQSCLKRL